MVISNQTIETINYVKDIDIEFNMKILIMGVLLLYSIWALWFSFRLENKKAWVVLTKYIVMRGMTIPFIAFYPFSLMLVYRQVSLEAILGIMLVYYSVLFVIAVLIFSLFGLEWILGFFGIKNLGEILTNKIGNNIFKRRN